MAGSFDILIFGTLDVLVFRVNLLYAKARIMPKFCQSLPKHPPCQGFPAKVLLLEPSRGKVLAKVILETFRTRHMPEIAKSFADSILNPEGGNSFADKMLNP